MANTLWHRDNRGTAASASHDKSWSKRMSDHIAFGLLIYTGLNIFVTMEAVKGTTGSILPYFGLVVLVAAIIPACLKLEHRWKALGSGEATGETLRGAFNRDRALVWLGAIGLPFATTAICKMLFASA